MNEKEIKRQIRALRKLKKDLQKKSEARRDVNRQIRGLKKRLDALTSLEGVDPEKMTLIKEIYEREPLLKKVSVDLTRFTIDQLRLHIERIKTSGRTI